jgi:hypothetical protein
MRLSAKCALAAAALLLAVPALLAQDPKTQPPPTTPPPDPAPRYRMNDVAKSLDLTLDQIRRLNEATDRLQNRYARDYTTIQTLPERDRPTRVQQWMREYTTDWSGAARDILNDRQMGRYNQLWYQYNGFNTFADPDLQTRFKLTEQQRARLRDETDWNAQQLREINEMARTDPNAATRLYNQYWKDRQERLNKFLTPEQQRAWNEMIGDPYTFQPQFPRR